MATAVNDGPAAPRGGSHDAFPQLDGYRALAVSCVIATHAGFQSGAISHHPWNGIIARLDFGVTLFFLLSGFLLFRPIAAAHLARRRGPQTAPYLWRRALRILPAYWLAVSAALLLLPANRGSRATDWLAQLGLGQTYVHDGFPAGLTQMWSLGTEVMFYLFLPLFGFVVVRLSGRQPAARLTAQIVALAVLAATAVVWRSWTFDLASGGALQRYWLPAYLDWFALGMVLASVHAWRTLDPQGNHWIGSPLRDLAESPGACWVIGLSFFWVATMRIAGPYDLATATAGASMTKHVLFGAAAFFMLLPATLGQQRRGLGPRLWSSRPLSYLGTVSYGMFLWNMLILELISRATGQVLFGGHFWRLFLLTYLVTVAVASASWYAVERPLLRLRRLVPGSGAPHQGSLRTPSPTESAPAP